MISLLININIKSSSCAPIDSYEILDFSGINVTQPSDLVLSVGNSTNSTISWTLTDEGPFDYLGEDSFTADTVGAEPSGWDVISDLNTETTIISEIDGHRMVANLSDGNFSGLTSMKDHFSNNQTTGTIEFYWQASTVIEPSDFIVSDDDNWIIYFASWSGEFIYWDGNGSHTICSITNDQWYHLRLNWTSGNFSGWEITIDGLTYGAGYAYGFFNPIIDGMDALEFSTSGNSSSYYNVYIDAVDYSWASGYYLNRNMDFISGSYAVFKNNTQQTNWQQWSNQTQVDYNVSGASLGVGIHNISLVFNDTTGQWYHDDVNVTVTGPAIEIPNIVSVVQDPSSPTYKDNVRITAHITDSIQIQSVYIETNDTVIGNLENRSMTLFSGTLQDGIWNYTFDNYSINKVILYRIFALNTQGKTNVSAQFSFGVFDTIDPTIVSVIQNPANLTRVEPVNVTTYITDNFEILMIQIESDYMGTWANYSMDLLSGSLQDGIWNFTFDAYPVNTTINYRIFATDVSGRTAASGFYTFSIFPIISWKVSPDLYFEIEIGQDRECPITFNFDNTGTTILLDLNFTITSLPANWSADQYSQVFTRLDPGENIEITFVITVSEEIEVFYHLIPINFSVTIYELGEKRSEIINVAVAGVKGPNFVIWIIVIFGSVTAIATTSFLYTRKRRRSSGDKKTPKALGSLKNQFLLDFPEGLMVVPTSLRNKINQIEGLTEAEKEFILQELMQLDEKEAELLIDGFKSSLND